MANAAPDGAFALPEAIRPGELITLRCPPGGTVPFKVGDALSKTDKGEATTKVIRIEGQDILVGAMRAGDFKLEFECPGSTEKVSMSFRIVALKKEEIPEAAPPLAPLAFAYPLWFWLALAAALLALTGGGFWIYRKLRRKLTPAPVVPAAKTLNARESFTQFITEVQRSKVAERDDDASLLFLYGQGYERLRKFLEFHYELKTIIETTREFLGSLRAAAPQIKLPLTAVDAIDALLSAADRVRFAKAQPPLEERKLFAKRLVELHAALSPRVSSPTEATER